MSFGPPRLDYFVRVNAISPSTGPFDFRTANAQARELSSQKENTDGTAEIITFVGSRVGDPPKTPALEVVKFMYVRGRLLFSGGVARFNSSKFVGLGIGRII